MTADVINSLFEGLAGLFVLNHCRILYGDKAVRGVSIASVVFFWTWGAFNTWYYPHLGQAWSFYGGMAVVTANTIYVCMLFHYRRKQHEPRYAIDPAGSPSCGVPGHDALDTQARVRALLEAARR